MRRLKKHFAVFITMCLILTSIVVSPIAVSATGPSTYNVSTYSDLTAAISSAQAGDIINITSDITITAEIAINKNIILNGNGHTLAVPTPGLDDAGILSASPSSFRVFNCNASGKTIEINNVNLKGGQPVSRGGAIVNNAGTTLKLTDVNISNSGGTLMAGGGINNIGTAYLLRCNISRNGGNYGGGFLNSSTGTMFIEDTTFSENRSLSTSGGGGAGENQGTLYVNNSTFANNISTELGSAINNYNGTMYILNSSFIGNVAASSYSSGAVRSQGTAKFVNCIFAHNYYTEDNGENYSLGDFSQDFTSGVELYNCVYHQSTLPSGNVSSAVNCTQYTGKKDGSDNFLSAGGSTTKLVAANGIQMGSGTIFQPFLVKQNPNTPPANFLKSGSVAYNKAADSAFLSGTSPIVAYKNNTSWVYLVGSSNADSNIVTLDQVGQTRGSVGSGKNAVGSTVLQASDLVMLRVLAASGGSVFGGSLYGDIYANGTQVTVTAYPNAGEKFTGWNQTINGTTTTVAANPFTITLTSNTDLQPTYTNDDGYTITYNGNGNTEGVVPNPSHSSAIGEPVTIDTNSGVLVKDGFTFAGWNTRQDGSGITFNAGTSESFANNTILYALWTVKLPVPPSITTQPQSQTVTVGSNVSLSVAAAGDKPLSYQWKKDGVDISGANSATLAINDVQTSDAGEYTCYVSNTAGNATSAVAGLTVNPVPVPPSITTQPQSQTVTVGSNVSLSVAAAGDKPLSYQWKKDGVDISGANSTTLAINDVQTSDAGEYTCYVSNTAGNATSAVAGLTVNQGSSAITGKVEDSKTNSEVAPINATVTTENDGSKNISMKETEGILVKEADGSEAPLENISNVTIVTEDGTAVPTTSDGTISFNNLVKGTENNYKVYFDLGNGQKVAIGSVKITVSSAGDVSITSTLIDPYGKITDAATGKAISGAKVQLYYADTARNMANGKTPNTLVSLPLINNFKPNNNQNPQVSDAFGGYEWMVFPSTDYYIVATKDGYNKYVSPTISVEQDMINYNFSMLTSNKLPQTGTFVDFNLLLASGFLLIVFGFGLNLKLSKKKR